MKYFLQITSRAKCTSRATAIEMKCNNNRQLSPGAIDSLLVKTNNHSKHIVFFQWKMGSEEKERAGERQVLDS